MYNMSVAKTTLILFFFFNDTATTEIYTLSLHDALPISRIVAAHLCGTQGNRNVFDHRQRSEEHTSELQSPMYLVCRLLLEKNNRLTTEEILSRGTNDPVTAPLLPVFC